MTVPNRVIPPDNLPPKSRDWARGVQVDAEKNRDDLNALAAQADFDQRQLNTTIGGVGTQTASVRARIKSLSGGYTYSMTVSQPAIPANTWTTFSAGSFQLPANKNRAMIYASGNVVLHLAGNGTLPAARVALNTGIGAQIDVPLQGRKTLANESYRSGSYTSMGTIAPDRQNPGVMSPTISVWTAVAFPADVESVISFYVHFLYGGNL